ncbi:MAG: DUF418 domain-containing protein [Sphingomonas sp.]|uniref:DUF418 domain-containing protein n=1 Tax=Sphingomonas sp. TaxID=28214 RepID=UPI003F7CE64B
MTEIASNATVAEPGRLRTLDAVRGVAVMSILLLNIIDFAMPGYAEIDPSYYGGAMGANWWEWAIAYVIGDAKFRGLFTMMFGASTILIADRALASGQRPAVVHYARMATLVAFGMVHAYLIWSGDILVLYALVGMIAFLGWRVRPRLLMTIGMLLLAFKLVDGLSAYRQIESLRIAVATGKADAAQRTDWRTFEREADPHRENIPNLLSGYRGSYADAFKVRLPETIFVQTVINRIAFIDTFALMLIGMALFRWGFFSGAWSRRAYWTAAAGVPLLWLCYVPLVDWLDATRWSQLTMISTEAIQLTLLRPWLSLGYAALVILFVQSDRLSWLADRFAATGRMAFSNYLGTSIVCTLIFNGYGLGWYGHLQRWQCLIVVAGLWVLMLAWSKPWLDRFVYGPFEWLWRSAARGRPQPFRRRAAVANVSQ